MLIDEKIQEIQNLTKRKITYAEVAQIFGLTRSAVQNWSLRQRHLKEYEIQKINEAFSINNAIQKDTSNDIIKIPYIEWLPEEMKNPKYPDVVSRSVSIDDWGQIESLRIVAMNGNSLENYWYKIQNKDVLLIDTSETKVNADGRGVYFATSQNNTKFWIREMTEQLDGSIEFRAYPKSEIITKVYSKQQLKEADFKIIGKVIKNVSLKLN